MLLSEKPVLSNQHGALVMAFIPYVYGIIESHWLIEHLWLGLSWLFAYLFSYPFFSLFSKPQNKAKYQKWAVIYGILSLLFALPMLISNSHILQFLPVFIPLAAVQIYYAKQKDERNIVNDIAGILTFGVVGMASFYLASGLYSWEILLHPTLFFIATTFYIKSVARERKNPRYLQLSLGSHLLLGLIYIVFGYYAIAVAYAFGLIRAVFIPKQKWSIKQIGMFEFIMVAIFFTTLCL